MQYSEGSLGRCFVLRLEHGEPMPQALEEFAAAHGVQAGLVLMVGGAERDSRLVVGPEEGAHLPPKPMVTALSDVHEIVGVGTLFPDRQGRPVLHMHAACGRGQRSVTGCIRAGVVTWQVLEIILIELKGLAAARLPDPATGFDLLQCSHRSTCQQPARAGAAAGARAPQPG
jgi:predicted DNA-binding protein with PD1-like motif